MISSLILKEGHKSFYYALGATIFSALFLCSFLTTVLAIYTLLVVYIYKNTNTPTLKIDGIASPTDGVVTAIDKVGEKQIVYVKLSLCDNHVLRAPIDASMKVSRVQHGLNLDEGTFKGKHLNTQHVLKFDKIKILLLDGRYNCITKLDETKEYGQNSRFGVMMQGEVQIVLPKKVTAKVKMGQKVYAGKTVLA